MIGHPSEWYDEYRSKIHGSRVLFINMPLREHALPNNIPLGPALMAARLRQYGVDVRILDLNAYRPHLTYEEITKKIHEHGTRYGDPHLVGISGLITTLSWQIMTAKICREAFPDTSIVSGGGLSTDLPRELMQWIPELDAVATGEGDDIIFKILHDAINREVQGIYLGQRPVDLDALPFPAWDLCDLDVYLDNPIWGGGANNSSETPFSMTRSMNSVSSRGCPFACKYCDRTATGGRTYDVRSAENMWEEQLSLMNKYDIDFMGWVDDNAMVLYDRLKIMGEMWDKSSLLWGTHGRLDEAADMKLRDKNGGYSKSKPPRVAHMAKAGCRYIGFGAESADPLTLEFMDKGGQTLYGDEIEIDGFKFPEPMMVALQNCREYDIHPNCTWIMGYPGETLSALKTTVRFIMWMQDEGYSPPEATNKSIFVATAYPGTEMFNDPIVKSKIGMAFGSDFKNYVLELDDATKVIEGDVLLNYSAMDDKLFMKAREHVESGEIEKILLL